jgi:hypothetical protein
MYYIDDPIAINKSFVEKPICAWHIVARITVDYINKSTVIELASWENKESFLQKGASLVSFLTVNDSPRFSVDPSLFAMRALTSVEGSPFYRKQIKCDYELDHISQVWAVEEPVTPFNNFE